MLNERQNSDCVAFGAHASLCSVLAKSRIAALAPFSPLILLVHDDHVRTPDQAPSRPHRGLFAVGKNKASSAHAARSRRASIRSIMVRAPDTSKFHPAMPQNDLDESYGDVEMRYDAGRRRTSMTKGENRFLYASSQLVLSEPIP